MATTPIAQVTIATNCALQGTSNANYLDWTQRPPVLQQAISEQFESIASRTYSNWGIFNGMDKYKIGRIDEHALMKKIIENALAHQKEFYALDIGAGNFQWLSAMADYLNNQPHLQKDIKIHIIGIRGEAFTEPTMIKRGLCTIYRLGAFKIEEIAKQFEQLGLSLNGKIDLAISHYVFLHFFDPIGTFAQVYHLLRPSTGFLLTDGFSHDLDYRNEETANVFLDTSAPFLRIPCQDHSNVGPDHFILRRPDDTHCQLPLHYTETVGKVWHNGVKGTKYERTDPPRELLDCNGFEAACGDKSMYEFLRVNRLDSCLTWYPIQEKDRIIPPLHTAILANNQKTAVQLLEHGGKINELDPDGATPLDLCFKMRNLDLFTHLLSKGADANLCRRGKTTCHDVAAENLEGRFLQALVNAGVNINQPGTQWKNSPLDGAIWGKNVKAVEILIKNGAKKLFDSNRRLLLKDPAFEPLRASGLIADFLHAHPKR